MDGLRFDRLTRSLAAGTSRRSMLKGAIFGGLGLAAVKQSAEAGATSCDEHIDCFRPDGLYCCVNGVYCSWSGDSGVCCGSGTCPAGEQCCGDTNCCAEGYVCNGTECCQTCAHYPGQCGDVQAYCGNTPITLSCPAPSGSVCCNGTPVTGNCCGDSDCGGNGSAGACEEDVCVNNVCQVVGCPSGTECCDGVCQAGSCESEGCSHDRDCEHGCCCGNGDCSTRCCPDEDDDPKPPPPADGKDEPIKTLPNTGSGATAGTSSLATGAVVLGGAAALGAAIVRDRKRQESQ